MRNPTTLVVGASGVGKSTACLRLVDQFPHVLYVSASAVLASIGARPRFEATQLALGASIGEIIRRARRPAVVDCHILLDSREGPVHVPAEAIERMRPSAIVALTLDEQTLHDRRRNSNPPRPSRSIAELHDFQALEKSLSRKYASYFDAIYIELSADHPDTLVSSIVDRHPELLH